MLSEFIVTASHRKSGDNNPNFWNFLFRGDGAMHHTFVTTIGNAKRLYRHKKQHLSLMTVCYLYIQTGRPYDVHCVSKRIPNIIDYNVNKDYQVLVIPSRNIPNIIGHQTTVPNKFPPWWKVDNDSADSGRSFQVRGTTTARTQGLGCRKAASLPDAIYGCRWTQEATGSVWLKSGAEHYRHWSTGMCLEQTAQKVALMAVSTRPRSQCDSLVLLFPR